jgi:hypothetical protein
MPESMTAIVTSGRPVVICQAVGSDGLLSSTWAPRTPFSSTGLALIRRFVGSGEAEYLKYSPSSSSPTSLGTWSVR